MRYIFIAIITFLAALLIIFVASKFIPRSFLPRQFISSKGTLHGNKRPFFGTISAKKDSFTYEVKNSDGSKSTIVLTPQTIYKGGSLKDIAINSKVSGVGVLTDKKIIEVQTIQINPQNHLLSH